MTRNFRTHTDEIVTAIQSLEDYFRKGGTSIIQAAFQHTFFIHPDAVRRETPLFPNRARYSREHYPDLGKGRSTVWKAGDSERSIILDDNSRAQMAWERYTGRRLARRSGYGVRHIWGNTHNPDAFTAGWNICYMPFWAGMLTEDQHPHPELQAAIRQASWELYFSDDPVCEIPDFVRVTRNNDTPINLNDVLEGNPLLILSRESPGTVTKSTRKEKRGAVLPITLDPPDSDDFLSAILRTKEAWIEISYENGGREVRHWRATQMKPTSNVIGNLRSRPEFEKDAWQKLGIASVRVSIEHPDNRRR